MRVEGAIPEAVAAPIAPPTFDPRDQKPVSDEVFAVLKRSSAYEPRPLDALVERREDQGDWIRERVTFAPPYEGERVIAHVFLPKTAAPPFQAVVFWPGSGATKMRSSERLEDLDFDWLGQADLVRAGRAVVYPVYYGTYERAAAPGVYLLFNAELFKDLYRTIEYLETRADIDAERLAFMGASWGAHMGSYLAADVPRHPTGEGANPFKAIVLAAGGLSHLPVPPEFSQATWASRIKTPVLMINGRYDTTFSLETQVEPLFELLGTTPEHKRLAVFDGGHWPGSLSFLLKETLDWLDRYLGPVTKTPPVGGETTDGS